MSTTPPIVIAPSILCADDDPVIREIYHSVLVSRDYSVRLCEDGANVMPELLSATTDLLILDIDLPNRDGLSILAAIRKNTQLHDLPVLLVTSVETEDQVAKGYGLGADDYLIKPVKPGELLAKVAMAFNKRKFAKLASMGFAYGTLFNRRYEVHDTLGSGGFSTIYHALDTTAKPPLDVALKIWDLPPAKRHDTNFLSHFLREAYEHSKMDHPNVVRLYDFGQSDNIYFLALEYLKGETLLDWIKKQEGPLPEKDIARIGFELSKALMHLYDHGIVHRDIKPQNIFHTEHNEIKLLDFGLARRQTDDTLSVNNEFRGSPMFVSPEHIRGDLDIDTRADIYSLGAALYYASSRQFPITGDSIMDVVMNHLKVTPIPLSRQNPNLSLQLCMLVDRMLAKNRDERPSIVELQQRFMIMSRALNS